MCIRSRRENSREERSWCHYSQPGYKLLGCVDFGPPKFGSGFTSYLENTEVLTDLSEIVVCLEQFLMYIYSLTLQLSSVCLLHENTIPTAGAFVPLFCQERMKTRHE